MPKVALNLGSSARHIQWCISGYVPVDETPQTGAKASKMGELFYFLRPYTSENRKQGNKL
ncbi:MAG: hypothetical protein HKP58_02070 [Desulfatitalea sp.]|nr:hypothetical protein [Desulfatitalea sp.]NNJ99175.1 hypothetical protein [Desulfatitalea sp.]